MLKNIIIGIVLLLCCSCLHQNSITYEDQPEEEKNQNDEYDLQLLVNAANVTPESMDEFIDIIQNTDEYDENGKTAIIYAVELRNSILVEKLIQAGLNPDSPDNEKKTPLMYAIGNGDTETINILIQSGSDLDAADISEKTALIYALEMNAVFIIEMLINSGAYIEEMYTEKIEILLNSDEPVEALFFRYIGSYTEDSESFYIFKYYDVETITISVTKSDNGWELLKIDKEAFYLRKEGRIYKVKKA